MKRSAFQGVATVVRFNWHFYVLALAGAVVLVFISRFAPAWLALPVRAISIFTILSTGVSLVATWFAYDASGLYRLHWLTPWLPEHGQAANIHAGFDETTPLLRAQFPGITWRVFDFYDPVKHTEVSIRRARHAHPPAADTVPIATRAFPVPDGSLDRILLLLAAHEIRDEQERIGFFRELHRGLTANGLVIVTEHLRDAANIAVYNLGAWHFHSDTMWRAAFEASRFDVVATFKPAPLMTTFVLKKHGVPA